MLLVPIGLNLRPDRALSRFSVTARFIVLRRPFSSLLFKGRTRLPRQLSPPYPRTQRQRPETRSVTASARREPRPRARNARQARAGDRAGEIAYVHPGHFTNLLCFKRFELFRWATRGPLFSMGESEGERLNSILYQDISTLLRSMTRDRGWILWGYLRRPKVIAIQQAYPFISIRGMSPDSLFGATPQPRGKMPTKLYVGNLAYSNSFSTTLCDLFGRSVRRKAPRLLRISSQDSRKVSGLSR